MPARLWGYSGSSRRLRARGSGEGEVLGRGGARDGVGEGLWRRMAKGEQAGREGTLSGEGDRFRCTSREFIAWRPAPGCEPFCCESVMMRVAFGESFVCEPRLFESCVLRTLFRESDFGEPVLFASRVRAATPKLCFHFLFCKAAWLPVAGTKPTQSLREREGILGVCML